MLMRIVGMSPGFMNIQTRTNGSDWKQEILSPEQFENFMKKYFPIEYGEYCDFLEFFDESIFNFFYHYRETPKMIREGEAYIFTTAD